MSWLYSQALVVEYLAASCSDGAPFAPLSGKPTPQAYCAPDRTTAHSRLSRFGMTCAPLTEDRGAELLTWYLAAFHAKTSAQQAEAQELRVKDRDCGVSLPGLLAKYDHDTRSWKTAQCLLSGDSEKYSVTWPKSGMMRSGVCWERTMLARYTKGKESGYWPTPTMSMYKGSSPATLTRKDGKDRTNDRLDHRVMAENGGQLNPTWVEWLMGWPLEWTDLKPSATDKFPQWLRLHGKC